MISLHYPAQFSLKKRETKKETETETEKKCPTYCSEKVRFRSHAMMGRFFLSLYVGKMTEYLFADFIGAILEYE